MRVLLLVLVMVLRLHRLALVVEEFHLQPLVLEMMIMHYKVVLDMISSVASVLLWRPLNWTPCQRLLA
jgi:hypothetical protein